MSGLLWTALGVLGGLGMTAIGDMVSEEVRDRLDHLPHAILRLAARWLDPSQRAAMYDDEWMPELIYILKGDEARPITRLYHGTCYAVGILFATRQITGHLQRERAVQDRLRVRFLPNTVRLSGLSSGERVLELEHGVFAGYLDRMVKERETDLASTRGFIARRRATEKLINGQRERQRLLNRMQKAAQRSTGFS